MALPEHGERSVAADVAPREVDEPLPRAALHRRPPEIEITVRVDLQPDVDVPRRAGRVTGYEPDRILALLHADVDVVQRLAVRDERSTGEVAATDPDPHDPMVANPSRPPKSRPMNFPTARGSKLSLRLTRTILKEPPVPLRDEAPIGAPCWVDIMTSDPAKTQAFYTELFGWTVDDPGPDYGGYINFHRDGVPVAGLHGPQPATGPPTSGRSTSRPTTPRRPCEAAAAHGGMVMFPPMDVMALGKMAIVLDAGGAAIGVWQPGEYKGFGVLAEPARRRGSSCTRVSTTKSVQFYRDVFKWDTHVDGRHGRVPLHDARRRREPGRRHHGRQRLPARRRAR